MRFDPAKQNDASRMLRKTVEKAFGKTVRVVQGPLAGRYGVIQNVKMMVSEKSVQIWCGVFMGSQVIDFHSNNLKFVDKALDFSAPIQSVIEVGHKWTEEQKREFIIAVERGVKHSKLHVYKKRLRDSQDRWQKIEAAWFSPTREFLFARVATA